MAQMQDEGCVCMQFACVPCVCMSVLWGTLCDLAMDWQVHKMEEWMDASQMQ